MLALRGLRSGWCRLLLCHTKPCQIKLYHIGLKHCPSASLEFS